MPLFRRLPDAHAIQRVGLVEYHKRTILLFDLQVVGLRNGGNKWSYIKIRTEIAHRLSIPVNEFQTARIQHGRIPLSANEKLNASPRRTRYAKLPVSHRAETHCQWLSSVDFYQGTGNQLRF